MDWGYWAAWALIGLLCLDARKDRTHVSWLRFAPFGLLLLALPQYLSRYGAPLWYRLVDWEIHYTGHIWNWDHLFASIPLNDPAYLYRLFPSAYLVGLLRWVYWYGFIMAVWGALVRSFVAGDWRKMVRYALASQALQTPIIVLFYQTVELHEVWWVQHYPDFLLRATFMTPQQILLDVQNCFPSMHTSIAFAIMLLAQREKGPIFRWGMTLYTGAVIFSTLYLRIHWVIDMLAGLVLGYGVVKLTDWLLVKTRVYAEGGSAPEKALRSWRLRRSGAAVSNATHAAR